MRYIKPHFYGKFQCVADKCPDTCCAGWQIMIDEESLERYAGEESLKNSIDWQEGCFYQYHGRCAMLNDRNLCDMVIEKGEEWLCDTCNRYPRHIEEFEGLRELSLSLSCPVAAELIFTKEPLHFLVEEDEEEDPLEEEFEDFDFLLFTQLEDSRNVIFDIIQNRKIPIHRRMSSILELAKHLQLCVDEERLFDMEEVIGQFAEDTDCEYRMDANRHQKMKDGFDILNRLERLRDDWTNVLKETGKTLYEVGSERYEDIHRAFCEEFCGEDWDVFLEQLLMFFVYTYYCGAVYDDCIYSKVALAVFSACMLQEFVMCKWFLADKYINKQECIRLAYRYAREVEHSDDNLNLLEEWLLQRM